MFYGVPLFLCGDKLGPPQLRFHRPALTAARSGRQSPEQCQQPAAKARINYSVLNGLIFFMCFFKMNIDELKLFYMV